MEWISISCKLIVFIYFKFGNYVIIFNKGIFVLIVFSFKECIIGVVNCLNVICCLGIFGDVLVDGKK